MDRYQFEDKISAYLEKELTPRQRQEFEFYMEHHPDARELVDSVRDVMQTMHDSPTVSPSPDFMPNLMRRIENEKQRPVRISNPDRTWLGFRPLHAGLMTVVVVGLFFVGRELWQDLNGPAGSVNPGMIQQSTFTGNNPQTQSGQSSGSTSTIVSPNPQDAQNALARSEEDSSKYDEEEPVRNVNVDDRIQYVKNPQ